MEMKNRKILATFMALGMVTMGFALLAPVTPAADEPGPTPLTVPTHMPIDGVYAPLVTDNQAVAFRVSGWCDVAVDVSLEVGTFADFGIGAGDVGIFTTTDDNFATGIYRVAATGLTGSTIYNWRLTLVNGADTIYYPDALTTATAQTCLDPGTPPINGDPLLVVQDDTDNQAQNDFLSIFYIDEGGVMSFPQTFIGVGTNIHTPTGNNFRANDGTFDYLQDSAASTNYMGAFGMWDDPPPSVMEGWVNDTIDTPVVGSGPFMNPHETHKLSGAPPTTTWGEYADGTLVAYSTEAASFVLNATVADPELASVIAAAEYYMDVDLGPGLNTPIALPTDGVWDEIAEEVDVTVNIAAWVIGEFHTFYIRGQEAADGWGTVGPGVTVTKVANQPPTVTYGEFADTVSPLLTVAFGTASFVLNATLEDSSLPVPDTVTAAEYQVDGAGPWTAMAVTDAAWDEATEEVDATVNIAAWSEDESHVFTVHGFDGGGSGTWGAVGPGVTVTVNHAYPPSWIDEATISPASPYDCTLSDDLSLTIHVDDTNFGGATPTDAQYSVDGLPWVDMIAGAAAVNRTFTATIDMHNWTLAAHTIDIQGSDDGGIGWGAWDSYTYTVGPDTAAPEVTYLQPPLPSITVPTGTTVTVRIDVHDFMSIIDNGGTVELHWWNTSAFVDFGPIPMTFDGWAFGSNHNYFIDSSIVEDVAETVEYWVVVNDGFVGNTYDDSGAPRDITFQSGTEPQFPYIVKGFAQWYNGSHVVGYMPYNQTDTVGIVTVGTHNITGVWTEISGDTDAFGRYFDPLTGNPITLQGNEYTVGGTIWVNFTYLTYYCNMTTVSSVDGGESWVNGTFAIPANMTIDWIPWWNGILPAPLTNIYPSGGIFYINITIYDEFGNIAPGYYCFIQIETNETSAGQDLWTFGPGPVTVVFDGMGGALTDGYYNNTVILWQGGVWAIWVNATDAGGNPMTNLTWWDPVLPNGPQFEPAITWEQVFNGAANAFNYTHVQITVGGFFWRPVVGWNLVSVPKNVSQVYLTPPGPGGLFMASTAAILVEEAATLAVPPIAIGEIILSDHTLNSYPAVYDSWVGLPAPAGGTDFDLSIDYAYWLYVDADLSTEGVFIPCEPADLGDLQVGYGAGENAITAAGINTVNLGASWTMVNPSAGWWNNSAWWFGTESHVDTRGNVGNWTNFAGQLYNGGGWVGGTNIPWYGHPATLAYPAGYFGYQEAGGAGPVGSWTDRAVDLYDCAIWDPATQLWIGNSYDPAWYGINDPGQGLANDAELLYYAQGFIVWSPGGGAMSYDITYDWSNPANDAPAF